MPGTHKWIQSATVSTDDQTGELLVRADAGIEIKRLGINASGGAAAGNQLLAAVSGKKLCVLAVCLMAADAVNARFYSGLADTGTALGGPMPLGANGGFVLPAPPDRSHYWLATSPGQDLTLHLSAAVQCSGWIVYYEAD